MLEIQDNTWLKLMYVNTYKYLSTYTQQGYIKNQ